MALLDNFASQVPRFLVYN